MEFIDNDSLQFLMECSSFSELHQANFFYTDPLAVFMPLSPPLSAHSPSPPPQTAAHAIMTVVPLPQPAMDVSVFVSTNAEQQQQQQKRIKKPRRRAHDLPYATNLFNLNLSTHTQGPPSASSAYSRHQRPQLNKQKMILQPGSSPCSVSSPTPHSAPGSPAAGLPGLTAYKCDFEGCEKTFTRPYNLKSHRRTHTLERPYACLLCPKTFARQHDRNRHTKLHYGIKPHACHVCNKSFARQDALNRHLRPDNPEASCASIGNHRAGSKRTRKGF